MGAGFGAALATLVGFAVTFLTGLEDSVDFVVFSIAVLVAFTDVLVGLAVLEGTSLVAAFVVEADALVGAATDLLVEADALMGAAEALVGTALAVGDALITGAETVLAGVSFLIFFST